MKQFICSVLALLLIVSLCACGQKSATESSASTWQEQYDLGVRYLSEGNYEDAVIAFAAAIEIDPKQATAYVGRGNAYVLSGETEDNLTAAQTDYEAAIELDETDVEAYLGLASVYICRGEYNAALKILRQGMGKTEDNQVLADKIAELEETNDRFLNSDEFIESTALSQELQDYLTALIDTFSTNDPESVENILKEGFPGDGYNMPGGGSINVLKTQISGYKIELWDHSGYNSSEKNFAYRVEIRPQNGIAYGAEYQNNLSNGYNTTFYISGECVDWNWTGTFDSNEQTNYNDYHYENTDSGKMIDCLCDGIVVSKDISSDGGMTEIHQLYKYGIGQEYTDSFGHNQAEQNTYYTALFNTGGWTTIDEVKEALWWN